MELEDSLLGGSVLNYVGHRACVRKASQSARLSKRIFELSELFSRKEQAGGQEKNRLHRATRNGAWLLGKYWRATSMGTHFQCSPETDHDFLMDSPVMDFHVKGCQASNN